jgi:hypothetical protein
MPTSLPELILSLGRFFASASVYASFLYFLLASCYPRFPFRRVLRPLAFSEQTFLLIVLSSTQAATLIEKRG